MAFPGLAASASDNGSDSTVTTPSPSGGDRGILFACRRNGGALTPPTGWTEILDTQISTGCRAFVAYRDMDGSEGTTLTFSGLSGAIWCTVVDIYTGHDPATPPAITTLSTGTGTSPNPPSLDPSGWDVEDTLWIASVFIEDEQNVTGYPANYSNGVYSQDQNDVGIGRAIRQLAAASEDPGAFTLAANPDAWGVATLALRPAPVTGGPRRLPLLGVG